MYYKVTAKRIYLIFSWNFRIDHELNFRYNWLIKFSRRTIIKFFTYFGKVIVMDVPFPTFDFTKICPS